MFTSKVGSLTLSMKDKLEGSIFETSPLGMPTVS